MSQAEFDIVRSAQVAATPEAVFALIGDLRQWHRWHPSIGADGVTRGYNAPRGVGQTLTWAAKGAAGAGRMEILEAAPARTVVQVDFERPFKARNLNTIEIAPEGGGSSVTWRMRGPKPFMARLMGLLVSDEKLMGPHFEAGLAQLKRAAEAGI